jgi:hypothetical protein
MVSKKNPCKKNHGKKDGTADAGQDTLLPNADKNVSPAVRPTVHLLKHPANIAYRDKAKRTPGEEARTFIADEIGDDPETVSRWEAHVRDWSLHGYNVGNVADMVDSFKSGGIQPRRKLVNDDRSVGGGESSWSYRVAAHAGIPETALPDFIQATEIDAEPEMEEWLDALKDLFTELTGGDVRRWLEITAAWDKDRSRTIREVAGEAA